MHPEIKLSMAEIAASLPAAPAPAPAARAREGHSPSSLAIISLYSAAAADAATCSKAGICTVANDFSESCVATTSRAASVSPSASAAWATAIALSTPSLPEPAFPLRMTAKTDLSQIARSSAGEPGTGSKQRAAAGSNDRSQRAFAAL